MGVRVREEVGVEAVDLQGLAQAEETVGQGVYHYREEARKPCSGSLTGVCAALKVSQLWICEIGSPQYSALVTFARLERSNSLQSLLIVLSSQIRSF